MRSCSIKIVAELTLVERCRLQDHINAEFDGTPRLHLRGPRSCGDAQETLPGGGRDGLSKSLISRLLRLFPLERAEKNK